MFNSHFYGTMRMYKKTNFCLSSKLSQSLGGSVKDKDKKRELNFWRLSLNSVEDKRFQPGIHPFFLQFFTAGEAWYAACLGEAGARKRKTMANGDARGLTASPQRASWCRENKSVYNLGIWICSDKMRELLWDGRVKFYSKRKPKLGRCDSFLWNLKLWLTDWPE